MQVDIPYSRAHEAIKWAKENCPNYITFNLKLNDELFENTAMYITLYFGHENDAALFALRWL